MVRIIVDTNMEQLTVVLIDFLSLRLEAFKLTLVALQVADGLTDESLELLEDNDAVNSLLSWHPGWVDGHNLHVLLLDLLRCLRQ